MKMRLFLPLFISLFCSSSVLADIQSDKDLVIDKISSDIPIAWGMAVLPDGRILVTERDGRLFSLAANSYSKTEIMGLANDIFAEGQGGLFDVQLSPDYDKTGWIYFSYAKTIDGEGATTLARAKLSADSLTDWQDLLVTKSRTSKDVHFGGRITFDDKGHLFLSVGERGVRENAQNLMTHAGSIIRLNLDGTVPNDNPFVGREGALPEIWSYGHRNPQGLFYNKQTQQLWEIEHGPRGGDEINLIQAGNNYGWPEISYGKEYWLPVAVGDGTHRDGMEQPIKTYIPSIAPSSLIQYQGSLFKDWQGKLLIGALSMQHLNVVTVANNKAVNEDKLLRSLAIRIRNVTELPDGALLVSTDNGDIYRITPK